MQNDRRKEPQDLDEIVSKSVEMTLLKLGFDMRDPTGIQKDILHLRRSREICEMIQNKALTGVVAIIIAVFMGAAWMGMGAVSGKQIIDGVIIK